MKIIVVDMLVEVKEYLEIHHLPLELLVGRLDKVVILVKMIDQEVILQEQLETTH
tara:strand:- start:502 stop:666 length:165 start_codon:yes stop_codon:yes gene_type:complete